MRKGLPLLPVLLGCLLASCGNSSGNPDENISSRPETIHEGEALFARHCSSCHNFRQDAIGPQLAGITLAVSSGYLHSFIRDPKSVIASGEVRAKKLFDRYHVVMPSFGSIADSNINKIIAFLRTKNEKVVSVEEEPGGMTDPFPSKIPNPGLVVPLIAVAQVPATASAASLARINKLDYEPSGGSLFVMDLRGKLYRLNEGSVSLYLDLAGMLPAFIDQPGLGTGFGSFAFHPDFVHNGLLYTTHTEPAHTKPADFTYGDSIRSTVQWVLTEWKTESPGAVQFSGKPREIFRMNFVEGMHGFQEIIFNPLVKKGNPDYGKLYIGIGDGASVEKGFPFLARDRNRLWGKLLRIDPTGTNSRNGKYGIPTDNPFAHSVSSVLPEIFAFGFRNPNRICWAPDGRMLVTNIGHANLESVYLVHPGSDQGWPDREGSFRMNYQGNMNKVYPLPANDGSLQYNYPIAEFDHDEGKAIAGGYVYEGNEIPALKGKYLFGDIPSGRLFYIDMKGVQPGKPAPVQSFALSVDGKVKSMQELCGNDRVDLRFGHDKQGRIYIMSKADGRIWRLGR